MIIKLIQPKMTLRPMDTGLKIRMSPPLGLLTIAAMFEHDHTIIIENENVEKIDYESPVDLVGISITVDMLDRAILIAEKFRKRNIPVVAGGIHVTAVPEDVSPFFDAVSIGLAEKTWPSIIADVQKGTLKNVYRCSDPIRSEDIVPPAYHLLDKRKYLYTNIISTSRGCPFQCDFCYNSCEACKDVYVNRPVAHVLEDIKAIGRRHIMFIDDNLIGNPQWTLELVKALKPLHIKWNAAVSANIVQMPKLLDEMRESGCQSLFIGFESINDSSLTGVHKIQNHVNQFDQLVHELHRRGIMINASFVFGLDSDDPQTFQNTLQWIISHKIETVTSHILTPYPGTALYERMASDGRITTFDYSLYNTANVVFSPANMTPEELFLGYQKIYKDIYSWKNIFRRMPRAKSQWLPYLMFNIFYRKYGRFTDWLCRHITYERIGRISEKVSYWI